MDSLCTVLWGVSPCALHPVRYSGCCVKIDLSYHFVISTERSDEKSLMLRLRSLPLVRNDITL